MAERLTPAGAHRLPQYTAKTAVWLFVRHPADLDEAEREDLTAFCQMSRPLQMAYDLVQDFSQLMRDREGDRLDAWLAQVKESPLPELHSFVHGVEQDYDGSFQKSGVAEPGRVIGVKEKVACSG